MTMLLPNLIRVCIDHHDSYHTTGRVYTPTRKDPIPFQDWGRMLVEVDHIFDQNGFPQAFQTKRTFDKEASTHYAYQYKPESIVTEEEFSNYKGDLKTFNIIVQSRQYTSWQGDILDEQNTFITHFSDVLELLDHILSLL